MPRCGHRKNRVFHALDCGKSVVKLLNLFDRAAHNDVLHAVVVVEMGVLRTDDQITEIMLGFDNLLRQLRLVVIVNECNDPGDDGTFFPLPLHQCRADEMFDRLGTGWKPLTLDQFVKMLNDIFVNRNRNACDF